MTRTNVLFRLLLHACRKSRAPSVSQSYLIGGHSRGPEGEHISDVASDMAKTGAF